MFSERNPVAICVVGVVVTGAVLLGALNYDKLPFVSSARPYSAYFAEAGGLAADAAVQVSGHRLGKVSSVELDRGEVLVKFTLDKSVRLGDRTEAAIKTKTLLGAKILELYPRGDGELHGAIPLERTTSPYQLPDALGDLSRTIEELDTNQLSGSLTTLAETFKDTPPDVSIALQGVARFSETIDKRDEHLRNLLASANKGTDVLEKRADDVVRLLGDANALLLSLRNQSAAVDQLSGNVTALAAQLEAFIAENRPQFKPALEKLNGVLTILDNRRDRIQESIKRLNAYAMSLGESVGSGPFFKAYVSNLLPGQFLQPFIDAAFSDLGLDPNVLSPTERIDPQVGQEATPALPVPYPRTGQGGEPKLSLPDAITGKPGDPRYPYREPLPAPPPGGPPPGPPALPPTGAPSAPPPNTDVLHPAPDEVPSDQGAHP